MLATNNFIQQLYKSNHVILLFTVYCWKKRLLKSFLLTGHKLNWGLDIKLKKNKGYVHTKQETFSHWRQKLSDKKREGPAYFSDSVINHFWWQSESWCAEKQFHESWLRWSPWTLPKSSFVYMYIEDQLKKLNCSFGPKTLTSIWWLD